MEQHWMRPAKLSAALMCGALFACVLAGTPSTVVAQTIKKAQDKAGDAEAKSAESDRAFAAGVKAYDAGKFEPAIQSLSTALQGGGLSSQKIAKALYLRGLGYRKQGKPAQAISDLTAAVWLDKGLSDAEKADAMAARASAYREAGVSGSGASEIAKSSETPVAAVPLAQSAVGAGPATSELSSEGAGWETATRSAAASSSPAPAVLSALPADAEPAAGSSAAKSSSSNSVAGFFSNLFGGGSSSSASVPPPAETAAVPVQETHQSAAVAPDSAVSSWASSTEVAVARENDRRKATQVAAVAPASVEPSAKAAPAGKYVVQVATVRSRSDADEIAARLAREDRSTTAGLAPQIDEAVLGNMGTFYRVRLGPFRTAAEPQPVCQGLKARGFDCHVTTR